MYLDIESNEIITTEQLYAEYMENLENLPNEYNYSFAGYIKNCLTINNGTLEIIK